MKYVEIIVKYGISISYVYVWWYNALIMYRLSSFEYFFLMENMWKPNILANFDCWLLGTSLAHDGCTISWCK